MNKLKIDYFGLTRELPKIVLPSGDTVAFFDSVGDVELLDIASRRLVNFVQDFCLIDRRPDFIITTELKGIPIAHAVASFFGIPYIVLRKSKKPYMTNPIEFKGESITSGSTSYFVDDATADKLCRASVVWLMDDVFSTGGTLRLVREICNYYGASLTFGGFIMREVASNSAVDDVADPEGIKIPYFEFDGITCFATAILHMEAKDGGKIHTSK